MAGIYWDLKSIFHQLHKILIQYKYKVRKLGEFSRGGASVRCSLVPLRDPVLRLAMEYRRRG